MEMVEDGEPSGERDPCLLSEADLRWKKGLLGRSRDLKLPEVLERMEAGGVQSEGPASGT
jgi:hypothetical protein